MNCSTHTKSGSRAGGALGLLLALALCGMVGCGDKKPNTNAEKPAAKSTAKRGTNAEPVQVERETAAFTDVITTGQDPFFPDSQRRDPRPVKPANTNTGKAAAPVAIKNPSQHVALRGIIGSVGKQLALINNIAFAVGEEQTVQTPDGPLRVKCVEILERSVIVSLDGQAETKEIPLRD